MFFEAESVGLADKLDVEYEGKEEVRVISRFWFEQLKHDVATYEQKIEENNCEGRGGREEGSRQLI